MKKAKTLGQELIAALEDTLEFANGKAKRGRMALVVGKQVIDVRGIREMLGMTRDQFARAFRFNARTVQNWEQGTRTPTDHTLAYLQIIAANPKSVYHILHP